MGKERFMKVYLKLSILGILILALSGCVVTQYKNKNGQECTREYFTILGIPLTCCTGEPVAKDETPAAEEGTPIKVAPAAPQPSLKETTPAKTVEQNIKTAAQPAR